MILECGRSGSEYQVLSRRRLPPIYQRPIKEKMMIILKQRKNLLISTEGVILPREDNLVSWNQRTPEDPRGTYRLHVGPTSHKRQRPGTGLGQGTVTRVCH